MLCLCQCFHILTDFRTFRCIVTQKTTVGMLQYVKDPLEPDDLKGDLKGDLNGALTGERRDPLLEY